MTPTDADVIVVSADDDDLSRLSWIAASKHAHYIPDGAAIDRQVLGIANAGRCQRTGTGHQVAIDLPCDGVQAPGVEQRLHLVTPQSEHRQADVLRFGIERKHPVVGIVYSMAGIRDYEQRARTM